MTPADIEAMAREDGATVYTKRNFKAEPATAFSTAALARFADLVRAQALEDAARVCDARAKDMCGFTEEEHASEACAASIRALIPPPHPPGAPAVTAD